LTAFENSLFDIDYTNQFKKDVKLCYKRNFDLQLLENAIKLLAETGFLPSQYKPHPFPERKVMECHIQPDWLLIWKQENSKMILVLLESGTHSDLFG
jgi:mRNA interferase YafQ